MNAHVAAFTSRKQAGVGDLASSFELQRSVDPDHQVARISGGPKLCVGTDTSEAAHGRSINEHRVRMDAHVDSLALPKRGSGDCGASDVSNHREGVIDFD